ncbi:ribulose-phosphate 3-epimerase [Lachnospiraceae bacterium OF09-6]|nr:ribulose-phosphate 3-epimerase [Lachnospiraceae bacterium OF09-6]
MNILSPSILAADFTRLGEQISEVDRAGAEYLHFDVMDGLFVPSISFGMPVLKSVRKATERILDVHLMIENPERYVDEFADCGADLITVHAESCRHLDRVISQIHQKGKKAGVALNPATSLSALDYVLDKVDMVLIMTVNPGFGGQKFIESSYGKIRDLKSRMEAVGLHTDIEVDGGINADTLPGVLEAGANVIVAGSAVFKGNIAENVRNLKNTMEQK